MVAENREIISTNIWSVLVPAALLALLAVWFNSRRCLRANCGAVAWDTMKGSDLALTAAVPALRLAGLRAQLESGERIVEGIDLNLAPGEILGIVGESGAGKSTVALALLGYSKDGVRISAGELEIAGVKMEMSNSMRSARGSEISYVPQDPGQSLNPSLRISAAIEDILKAHQQSLERDVEVKKLLTMVGLPESADFARRYPHQLSGGQQQRILIAIALSCQPAVVVLDEPTTGLDVVTQSRILLELVRLRDEHRLSMAYVTHDLAVVGQIADRIAVMYAGQIVEEGPAEAILRRPRHPYTRGLLASIPDHVHPRTLEAMPGIAISLSDRHDGCAFASRCPQRQDQCVQETPALRAVGNDRSARCFYWQKTPRSGPRSSNWRNLSPEWRRAPFSRLRAYPQSTDREPRQSLWLATSASQSCPGSASHWLGNPAVEKPPSQGQ